MAITLHVTLENQEELQIDESFGLGNSDNLNLLIEKGIYIDPDNLHWDEDKEAGYLGVQSVKWVGNSDFEKYVAKWMNKERGNPTIYTDLIMNGIASGITHLIWSKECLRVIGKFGWDLQSILDDMHDSIGEMEFLFKDGFTFDRVVWCCFEETVRTALMDLQLDDI